MNRFFSVSGLAVALMTCTLTFSVPAQAAGNGVVPPDQDWPHEGIFGTYDRSALQRGFQVYKEVCSACHSMKQLSYRNLTEIGFTEEEVKAIAAQYFVTDGPNDDGEMFERPAVPADQFKSPFPNKKAARAANGGAYPADLSLIAKARAGGEDYIYALLTGYEEPPADKADTLLPGTYWNRYFPGHQISMAPPLMDGMVSYADGTSNSLHQQARDVAQFLAWASEPHMEVRKQMGIKVILFLIVFSGVMYAVKRKVWANRHS